MPSKFTEIGIDGVFVKEMPVFDGKQTDKYLVCSDGQELFYNTTVSKMAEKQFAEKLEHKSLARYKEWRTNFEKNTIKGDEQEIFLMNRYEMMTYLMELEKDTESDPEDRAKRAVAHLRSFKLVAKVVPNKKVYLRSLFWDPHQREKKRMVFQSDVRSVMQHILKQQHFQFCRKSYQKCWGTLFSVHDRDRWISIETLRLVYERIRVNMENITLVPDIEFASGVLSMPLASGCPLIKTIRPNDGEVVTEIHQAMFHVFQKVVCDIDWHDMEKNGKAKEALRRRILELMYSWSTDEFRGRSVNELEVNIGRLLELSSYQHIKKHNVITPLIKLFDGDFMDTVSEDFFYEECAKYGLPYAKDPESDQKPKQMPLWKVRLIFLDAWNDMFFGEGYKWFHEKVKAGIHSRTPINGVSIRKLETYIGVPKTAISVIIERVCSMLCTHVGIETPKTAEDWQHVEDGFLNKGKIRCLGSIDGKHIEIKAPPNSGSLFFNYKGYFSFVLLALVDSEGRFLWIDVGCPGSTNDASIFNNCSLKRILENGENLPMPSPLGTSHHPMPSFIVGDGIFPLSKYLMKPFSHKTQDVEEQVYNQELSRTRNIVENAFGRLSNRFRCFHGPLELSVSVAKQFVMSTCIIHNMMTPKADAPKISRHPSNFSTFRDHKEQREELKRFINL